MYFAPPNSNCKSLYLFPGEGLKLSFSLLPSEKRVALRTSPDNEGEINQNEKCESFHLPEGQWGLARSGE